MTIDHASITVPEDKFKECLDLYVKALEPLGYEIAYQFGEYTAGLGSKLDVVENYKVADFWVLGAKEGSKTHIAFRTTDRSVVDAFHAAALQAGGKDNGAPGIRAHYHPNYYGAFVIDAAGNNIEVVCHNPSS
ncbi:glyoxalase family [Trichoderma arundinaceum]|uniref:Glyoxalase family n=1 Tax=Trichoderma arundinaceum TaxID=490622 RepID=A0A395NF88_TRIAR|nr:glyoxalase family [Trichoderma arundinaceum]